MVNSGGDLPVERRILELELPPVSVIIAAYNEEKWISATLSSILESGFSCELIVVDDGSTDSTPQILASFDRIKTITHPKNKGKGAAVASGVRAAEGDIVVLCDAHVLGLKKPHLVMLTLPLAHQLAEVTIGVEVSPKPPLTGIYSPMWILSGQRAYFKKDLTPLVKEFETLGYGLEVFLHNCFRDQRTVLVPLPGVQHLVKKEKEAASAGVLARSYAREVSEVIRTIAGIQSLTPRELIQFKDDFSLAFAEYLARGREESEQAFRSFLELLRRHFS